MYGNLPHTWSENLTIEEKCRYTINALMRMRFCKEDGELEFEHKLNIDKNPTGYKAWFLHKNRLMKEQKIFFWALVITKKCKYQKHLPSRPWMHLGWTSYCI